MAAALWLAGAFAGLAGLNCGGVLPVARLNGLDVAVVMCVCVLVCVMCREESSSDSSSDVPRALYCTVPPGLRLLRIARLVYRSTWSGVLLG